MSPTPSTSPNPSLGAKIVTVILIIAVPALLINWMFSCGDQEAGEPEVYDKTDALIQSRQFVEEKLVSPGSAEWPYGSDQVKQINDTVFIVESYVDSQNAMGALLRTHYRCDIVFTPSTGKVICKNLNVWQ